MPVYLLQLPGGSLKPELGLFCSQGYLLHQPLKLAQPWALSNQLGDERANATL